ncbi:Bifunctional NAD(P)H-hydrate repair enzyme Nnr [Defluviimonas aquaemixtae]|uniref:NAD(P)H-hydrate epimerase n=1 Tax=Albidovulum aquaemixtae TaxID=1542388 RepID=A0A2R8B517_9RHOB|nr:Bifunctional NAD(P)H-hydrate repair enzyme Nnr [Defluviimonas aquaemixtae]
MTELLTAAQMRAIEEAAIASGEVTGLELMERAGRGVVEAIFEEWPELKATSHRAVVLCGPGNNGGDGFVAARLLKEWSWEVEVFLYGDPENLPPDAKVNYERWCGMGEVRLLDFPNLTDADGESFNEAMYVRVREDQPLLIDALFGTGLTRSIEGLLPILELTDLYAAMPELSDVRTVAVDIPSGISSDTGEIVGTADPRMAVPANLTVTFHKQKIGHKNDWGRRLCGHVVVKDIGLGPWDRYAGIVE